MASPSRPPAGATLALEAVAAGVREGKRSQIPADADAFASTCARRRPSPAASPRGCWRGGVSVDLSFVDSSIAAETAADGSFTLAGVSPGRYALQLTGAPEGLVADWIPAIALRSGQTLTGITIPLVPSTTVPITFTDGATGAPVEGIDVYARLTRYPPA